MNHGVLHVAAVAGELLILVVGEGEFAVFAGQDFGAKLAAYGRRVASTVDKDNYLLFFAKSILDGLDDWVGQAGAL